jgi:alkylation response protein AidB-like acyl-CoA dehydrogenase
MAAWIIDAYDDGALRACLLPQLCRMELFASYCLTEPESGSDAASVKCRAAREGDRYVINGRPSSPVGDLVYFPCQR